ncbi:MAG: YbaB/EbfC family nucleoid-associated protein [Myxococcota bacterium]|nr:YbaB/EbfC family nucleoid-associated protein [Myxococcales bacterium]
MSAPDLGKLLASAREMQSRLAEVQRDLANRRIEGTAGGGMVRAVVDGQLRVHAVEIEPQMLATGDAHMLGDLCAAAVNAALANAQRVAREELERASGGLGGALGGGLGDALGKLFGGSA